jgi:hypothetical protein
LIWKQRGRKERLSLKTKNYRIAKRQIRDRLSQVRTWERAKARLTFGQVTDEWKRTALAAKDREYILSPMRLPFRHPGFAADLHSRKRRAS